MSLNWKAGRQIFHGLLAWVQLVMCFPGFPLQIRVPRRDWFHVLPEIHGKLENPLGNGLEIVRVSVFTSSFFPQYMPGVPCRTSTKMFEAQISIETLQFPGKQGVFPGFTKPVSRWEVK